ncbi:MAG: nucleoside kinase [Eubacteriales bacterium]|nr:nucleoside kinase [Eubacteriales bacterium]
MKLTIDGIQVDALCGETLEQLVQKAGLDEVGLARKPLAAQIGGEVYTLRYDPIAPLEGHERVRTAIHDAKGTVKLLRYGDDLGRRAYERTMLFILFLAAKQVFPEAKLCAHYSLGPGIYVTMDRPQETLQDDVATLHMACQQAVDADLPLIRKRLSKLEAMEHFDAVGQEDKVRLLEWRQHDFFDVYTYENFYEYFYGEMLPSTGYASVFDLEVLEEGFVLLLPDKKNPEQPAAYHHQPKLAAVFAESRRWNELLHCAQIADLNRMVQDGQIRELIRVSEALHEKSYANIADEIVRRKARAVMVAGPSSSGKTTSANRLYTQLRVLGQTPILLSLDNYYIDRDKIAPGEDGQLDLEHINTLDVERFNDDLARLLAGETVKTPIFDFMTGKRSEKTNTVRVTDTQPLIIEGIHGLNDKMLSPKIDPAAVFRVYVSALTTLNYDDHNRIRTTDIRILRRLVRDYKTRNASMEKTLSMWQSVRRGEETWIFPFQEQADAFLNTTLLYEPAVLKGYIYPLLKAVPKDSPYFAQANDTKFLNYFLVAEGVEDEIPPTSILREFIGGNTFYHE